MHVLYFSGTGDLRDLHSFPTRRSSDLKPNAIVAGDLVDDVQVDLQLGVGPGPASHREYERDFGGPRAEDCRLDRKSTRLNSSHPSISYAVFCLKKKTNGTSTNSHQLKR